MATSGADYLQRDQAPLSSAQWALLDQTVVNTARGRLIGRRLIPLVGPFGPGVEAIPDDSVRGPAGAHVDLLGNDDAGAIGTERRRFLPLPLLYKDFWLHWRDIEASSQLGIPLGMGNAAAAASAVAQSEDRLIIDGDADLDLPGLRSVDGRQLLPMSDWDQGGAAFNDVVAAVRALTDAGFPGPYGLLVSARQYAALNRVFDNTGVLELEQIEKLARRGVYPTTALDDQTALLVDSSAANMDLAVGVDTVVAYVESSNLNHRLRVLESLVLRVRRPGAVCELQRTAGSGRGR